MYKLYSPIAVFSISTILMTVSVGNDCERINVHCTTPSDSIALYNNCSNAITATKGKLHKDD